MVTTIVTAITTTEANTVPTIIPVFAKNVNSFCDTIHLMKENSNIVTFSKNQTTAKKLPFPFHKQEQKNTLNFVTFHFIQ